MTSKLLFLAAAVSAAAGAQDPAALERLLERIVRQENTFIKELRTRTPLLETYIQEVVQRGGDEPLHRDHYFLGRLDLASGLAYTPIIRRSESQKGSRLLSLRKAEVKFDPVGFAQMMFIDASGLDTANYRFEYVRREFLGDVRCIVFDVTPATPKAQGKFIGRIWVEDREFQIVRFNGTYTGAKRSELYFHFDSWRVNISPGHWIPAFSYVEEAPGSRADGLVFKAQLRFWGYTSGKASRLDELTSVLVSMDTPVKDEGEASPDVSPLEGQRSWEKQAEENVIERLEKSGIIAPKGAVDEVLTTVLNNLIATSGLGVEAHCRVLLTTPLETFSIGRTIVISRGLIDVLPDEASLAMVLSDELAHVALGHRTNTQFAFHDQTMFSDEQLLERFRFTRSPEEIEAAGRKAVDILQHSPYKDKMANAGLFLKAVASKAPHFPNLISANLGNRLAEGDTLLRMSSLAQDAPALDNEKLEQIPALPLGSRVKLDPWGGNISLIKTRPVSLLSAREKLVFEIAPMFQHLTRASEGASLE